MRPAESQEGSLEFRLEYLKRDLKLSVETSALLIIA